MNQGAETRREKLSGLFSDAIREAVKKLLDEEEKHAGGNPAGAIAHLQERLENGPLKEIERSMLNGLGKVHFVVLDSSKLDSLDKASCLQAGIRSRKIPRDRHVSSVAVYGGVMAFVEHEPMATDRIHGIMRREGLDHALDELCLAVTDLQDGLDLASLTDKCVNGLAQRKGTIANGCDMRVIDQETGVVHAGSRRHGTAREETREEETCYLIVQDAAPATPRGPGAQTKIYTRQMRFKSTKNPAPGYLRPGSTVILSVADMVPYLQHLAKQGLVYPDMLRRMGVRVDASLEKAIPIMGTVLRTDGDEVIVNVAGPLTLARYHLVLERARRNGGAPFISSDDIARAHSMPQLLEFAGRTRRGTNSTVPVPVFAGEPRRDQQTSRAVSFFGRTGMRIVFELGTDSAERLSTSLTASRDLARPLRLLSELRNTLLADIHIACQRAGTVSGRETLERLSNMAMQHIGLDPSTEPWIKLFTASVAGAMTVDAIYTPASLDQILRERLESTMNRISDSATVFSSFSSLPELKGIFDVSGEVRVTLSGNTVQL